MSVKSIKDIVQPVPEELLKGKNEKEKVQISREYRAFTRLNEQESDLVAKSTLITAQSENKRSIFSQPVLFDKYKKQLVKVVVPKVFKNLSNVPAEYANTKDGAPTKSFNIKETTKLMRGFTAPAAPTVPQKSVLFKSLSSKVEVAQSTSVSLSRALAVKDPTPSERIASLYTPSTLIRTYKQNEQISAQDYLSTYRTKENLPLPPVIPVKPEHKGVKGKDPALSRFISIEEFDNLDYELHTPQEWVSLGADIGGTPARSMYYTDDGEEVWAPCRVVSYDEINNDYIITWNHNNVTKPSKRLNIIFDAEDEKIWKTRIAEASALRDDAEAMVRYNLYVEGIEDGDIIPVGEDQIDHILTLVAPKFPVAHLNVIEKCIKEFRKIHKFGLKRALHEYKYRSPFERERLNLLNLPSVQPPTTYSLDNLKATIKIPFSNFNASKEFISVNLFQSHALLYPTLYQMQKYWSQYQTLYLCDVIMKKVSLPCDLHVFEEIQTRVGVQASQRLHDEWSRNVSSAIQNNLDGYFNFYEDNLERYQKSRMCRFFKLANVMMSCQLRQLLVDSINFYTNFLSKYNVIFPENFNHESDLVKELPEDISEKEYLHSVANELIADRIKAQEEAAKILKKQRGAVKIEEPQEEQVVLTDKDVMEFPYVPNELPYSSRIIKMTRQANGNVPLFVIRLIASGSSICFSPLLEELEDKVITIFDSFFSYCDNIPNVGSQFFPLLELPSLNLNPLERSDPFVVDSKKKINELINVNMEAPKQLLQMYKSFEYMLGVDDDKFIENFKSKKPTIKDYDVTLDRIHRDLDRIANRSINEIKFELIKVECESAKSSLQLKGRSISKSLLEYLSSQTKTDIENVSNQYEEIFKRLNVEPTNPEELQKLKDYIALVATLLDNLSKDFSRCHEAVHLLFKYKFMTAEDQFNSYWIAYEWPKKVQQQLDDMEFKCKEYRNAFMQRLNENCEKLNQEINAISLQIESLAEDNDERLLDKYYEKVMCIEKKIVHIENRIALYNSHELMFGMPTTQWQHIKDIKNVHFMPYKDLWETIHMFSSYSDGWMSAPIESLDLKQIDYSMQQWTVKSNSVLKKISADGPIDVAKRLKENLDKFRSNIPLIAALKCNLQQTHWKQIFQLIKAEKNMSPEGKTLQDFLKMDMLKYIDQIEEISETAKKTFMLESDLFQMEADWKKLAFELEAYGQTYKLKASDVIQQTLDEHIMKTQSVLGKPIIRQGLAPGVAVKASNWAKTLDNIQVILDEWYKCQTTWSYLEPIFSSADISKSLPTEAAKFGNINSSWIRIMETTRSNPPVISRCMDESLLKDFIEHNKALEDILKKLHIFLETKRMAFPRFYFISNEELLQILSDSKDPYLVQPYLSKCFEGIKTVQFMDNFDIVAMESAEKEVVPFCKKVNPADYNNQVEVWLLAVEKVMADSIRDHLKRAYEEYVNRNRIEFIRSWPGQIVLSICSLYWTMEASDAMQAEGAQGLSQYCEKCNVQLDDLILLVRDSNLKPVERSTLEALVVIEVHGRDIIYELAENEVDDVSNFDWLAQLRYYWTEDEHLDVCQINAKLRYGYEYLGNSSRLVITQLTDRCYRTLMGALHLNYGGAPEGPAGTGKTETTKDLAKALGKYCVVYNCTDQITAKDMAKLFKGLSQSGSWGCFDEFNRIEIQVLSVIAQQVATIQDAIAQKKVEFILDGCQNRLKVGCAVFITMNPGYAGRAELPDNLKLLFRPVAMMVPNYAMIGQIQLFSYGFLNGKVLAEKIVATYRLCSEQLSSQDHYDYGMRAVKTVLTAAGRLKRLFPDEDESKIMLRSIQDVNIPKFLSQDVELFKGIISDLFPGVVLKPTEYEDIVNGLNEVCGETNLQVTEYFKEKIFQTYEMIIVRHGMMIVGYSFAGKSSVLKSLAGALNVMNRQKLEEKTRLTFINPKSITMSQLYGKVDQSGEWIDGVLPKNFRLAATDTSPDRKWLIFDGPVDAVWIENMNTVLDDNKKLCLQNGDIIPMSKQMNMIFEVQDLAHASPATVSRCGMIYVEPESLGWKPLIFSYCNVMPNFLKENEAVMSLFDTMVKWLLSPSLIYVRKHCKSVIPQDSSMAVMSFIKLFGALMQQYDADDDKNEEPIILDEEVLQLIVEGNFLFSLVWSVGGCLFLNDRMSFNQFLFKLITDNKEQKLGVHLPDNKTFYDGYYALNEKEVSFVDWLSTLEDFVIPQNAEYQSIIIPTSDTAKYNFLIKKLVGSLCPALLVGDTGTGKTIMIKSLLNSYSKDNYSLNMLQFSAQTGCNDAQKLIDGKCERRRKYVYGPPPNKKMIIFIDDLNMPALEEYGAQPAIELLRQWLDYGGWYSHSKDNIYFREIEDILFLCAMGLPGGGRNPVTQRFTRHFNAISVPAFDEHTMKKIFGQLADWILSKGFQNTLRSLSSSMVSATADLYNILISELKPTPEKSHYTFNLRDVSKVFQGINMANPEKILDQNSLLKLWTHECLRAFADRFVGQEDTEWFLKQIEEMMSKHFRANYRTIFPNSEPVIFADFMNDRELYEDIPNLKNARKALEDKLENYNASTRSGAMEIVIFNYVLEHVARISRVLKQPSGNALLIGVGGSGRHSCCKLAAYILGYEYNTISIHKSYNRNDFIEDIRNVLVKAGQLGAAIAFCLSDSQIIEEAFLEDISSLLNTGEIPGIFSSKQDQETLEQILTALKDISSKDTSKEDLIALFVSRCKKFLHIVLCFSPIGKTLRERLRQFPSLVNCTTIDWFRSWPRDGLLSVASSILAEVDLTDELRESIRACFVVFHQDVKEMSSVYLEETRQQVYVTPTSYLELHRAFKHLLASKRNELVGLQTRYDNGLDQLKKTESEVAVMKEELAVMLPQLEKKAVETNELIAVVERERKEVEEIRTKVSIEEEAANKTAEKAKSIKDISQAKVDEASPKLEAAKRAAESLDNAALAEVKQTKKVMEGSVVLTVIECLCKMLGGQYKPKPVRDPMTGKVTYPYFEHAIRTLLTANFKSTLTNFANDMENLANDEDIVAAEKMLSLPSFEDKAVARASVALLGISSYIRNMVDYYNMNKVVKPLLAQAAGAQQEYDAAMKELKIKIEELRVVNETLEAKQQLLAKVILEKKDLEDKVLETQIKIGRATKLIEGLGGEKARYVQESLRYAEAYQNVVGDVVLSAGIVAYFGPFQAKYRHQLITKWQQMCIDREIPSSSHFLLEKFLGDPIAIQEWKLQQLPSDSFSVDNAIIMKHALNFPLMIDPQQQANKWIKNMERSNGLVVVRPSEAGYTRKISHCVQEGIPCLLENLSENIDAVLDNLLLKRLIRDGNSYSVVIDEPVEWNPKFRLYMTTKLPRPHYQPEVSTKVALINFLIKEGGLQDQLLQKVMLSERKEVEEKKQSLTIEAAANKASLKRTEDKILELLSSSGSLLENEAAILELDRSKIQSDKVAARQQDIEAMEKISDRTRQIFVPVAHVGATLFFCVAELANVDPMYQYSLQFYISLFQAALIDSEPSEDNQERIANIINTFRQSLYMNISRSLFAKDQLLFSFIMCLKLFNVDSVLVRWLLMGGFEHDVGLTENPCKEWLPDINWRLLSRASTQLPGFSNLTKVVESRADKIRQFFESSDPLDEPLPSELKNKVEVERLIIIRCLRPDKIVSAVFKYVDSKLGRKFIEPPLFSLEEIREDIKRDPSTAVIFVLSPGTDPNAELDRLADLKGMGGKRLTKLSLGQGQGKPARELLEEGRKVGNWVLLQNCHLFKDFMPELAALIEDYQRDDVKDQIHKDFCLWLTSLPSENFPVSILQNGVKLVLEPPKGLKSNLLRSFMSDPISDVKFFEGCKNPDAFKKLLFGLTFFHSVVQERRNFGPLGWNIPYEFNDTDMRISLRQLLMFIDENDEVPYDALSYLVGQCNYGGRVTDDWDRRCLQATLAIFFNPDILSDDYVFSNDCPEYFAPPVGNHASYVAYIQSLPMLQKPGIFGLHNNADITKDEREAKLLLESTLATQPREATGSNAALDPKHVVLITAIEIKDELPPLFDVDEIMEKYPIIYSQSMNTVLLQEIIRYNKLLQLITQTLISLEKAIRGEVVMSNELEQVFNSIYDGKIPSLWKKRSYPSLKPFGSYIKDFMERLTFFKTWIKEGLPSVFWVSGFFFTQSFFTGVMQNYARKYGIEIDKLIWDFTILSNENVDKQSDDGCYIKGLFLEGAGWSAELGFLCESKPKELYIQFPIIYLKPCTLEEAADVPHYKCPTYKTTDRRGILSTTGHSTNFIMVINLPRRQNDPENHWILRGTALFTQLEY